jgi:hypothetical protein
VTSVRFVAPEISRSDLSSLFTGYLCDVCVWFWQIVLQNFLTAGRRFFSLETFLLPQFLRIRDSYGEGSPLVFDPSIACGACFPPTHGCVCIRIRQPPYPSTSGIHP